MEEVLEKDTCACAEGAECTCGDNCTCGESCSCQSEIDKEKEHMNKLNEAYNKISELEDKLIRQNADMVNYRKRKEEEVNRMLKFCNEDLIKDILPILDNFERAISMESGLTEEEKKFLDGFKMVYANLQGVMEKYDVKMIDGSNKPFDPVYHNAILLEKREGVEPGMVVEILQKGYLLKEKVIRAAMVKVSE
jgi:molecular chaperone GrpE